ncbi:SpoIIE family protein phosphatase [Sphaerimonospora sp. CA-214678]|uniref:SpoIIE family protein phosphatase n=1 Tax=Sphaerimonospora sp. CA-214678 TaxID=3240029 RepID=UPI003D94653F
MGAILPNGDEWRDRDIDQAALAMVFSQSPVGLYVFSLDLRLVRYNTAGHEMRGVPSAELLGRPLPEIVPGFDVSEIEGILTRVRDTGEPVFEREIRGCPLGDPDTEHVQSISAFRLHDTAGRPLAVAVSLIDVTDRFRARARLNLMHEANARVGTTLDVSRTAEELADVVVPALADVVAIDVLDSVLKGEAPSLVSGSEDVHLRRLAFHTVRETDRSLTRIGEVGRFPAGTAHGQSLVDLRPRLIRRFDCDGRWPADDPARAELIHAGGIHSAMVVPLAARGVVLGLVSFYRWRGEGSYDDDDLALAAGLVDRAAVCMENGRRYLREHTIASVLQRSLLPSNLAHTSGVEVVHGHRSAGAGGDWFDVIPMSGARVGLVVGEVAGRGIYAAAAMGRLRTAIRTLAALDLAPDETLARLDDLVFDLADEHPGSTDMFERPPTRATCTYAVYDPISRHCRLARAGHLPPVLVHPGGGADILRLPAGPPLGEGGLPFECTELELPEGSVLALYTEGLLEGKPGGVDSALKQLQRALTPADRSLKERCDVVLRTLAPPVCSGDDAVLLLARTRTLTADHVATWTLPCDPAIVAAARTMTARQLAAWDLDHLTFSTELVVSELVTNAIRYASGPIGLRLIRDRTLSCEVSDHSSTAPHLRHARTMDERGRGLFLVAQTTQRWGTRYTGQGKVVWAEIAEAVA